MATLSGTHTKNATDTKLRGCRVSCNLQDLLKVGIQDTLVFLICLLSWDDRLFLKETGGSLILFYKIINGLAQVPFEDVLIEAYKG